MKIRRLTIFMLALVSSLLMISSSSASLITIELDNPGAEAGEMAPWTDIDFGIGNTASAHSGSWYFNATDPADVLYNNRNRMKQKSIDLSAYTGLIEDVALYAWADFEEVEIIGVTQDGMEDYYPLVAHTTVWFKDSSDSYLMGLGHVDSGSEGWHEIGGNSTWYSNWDGIKDQIDHVDIELAYEIDLHNGPDSPDWNDFVSIGWAGQEPTFQRFDDVRLEVTVVPVPPALILFGSSIALLGFSRKRTALL